jgi:hypothetical protein
MSFSREKARKNYKNIDTVQKVLTVNDWGIYYQGAAKPRVTPIHDSILEVVYDLPPDSGRWLTLRRYFTGIKDLASCTGIKFYWEIADAGDACLRFTICDLASAEDFGKDSLYRSWSYDLAVYYLGSYSSNWNQTSVDFQKFKKDSAYGGRPAIDTAPNLGLISAYEFTIFVPPATGKQVKGKFFIKSVGTFH